MLGFLFKIKVNLEMCSIFLGDSCSSGFVVAMYYCFIHFKFYVVEDCVLF